MAWKCRKKYCEEWNAETEVYNEEGDRRENNKCSSCEESRLE